MALLLACGGEHEAVDTVVMTDSTVVRKELPAALLAAEDLYALQIGERPPLLIDVRPAEEYAQGHIPGAVQLWRDRLTRTDLPYGGMAVARDTMAAVLGALGLRPDQAVVLYDDRGGCEAARVRWLMQVYGHSDVRILDGGWATWTGEGRSTDTATVHLAVTDYQFPGPVDSSLVATLADVQAALDAGLVLLDTRFTDEYTGRDQKKGAARPGTIPGSLLYDWGNSVDYDHGQCLRDADDLRHRITALGLSPEDTIITFCHSGVRSAHTAFVLREVLGFPHVRNYDGSWTEWSHFPELPAQVDTTGAPPA